MSGTFQMLRKRLKSVFETRRKFPILEEEPTTDKDSSSSSSTAGRKLAESQPPAGRIGAGRPKKIKIPFDPSPHTKRRHSSRPQPSSSSPPSSSSDEMVKRRKMSSLPTTSKQSTKSPPSSCTKCQGAPDGKQEMLVVCKSCSKSRIHLDCLKEDCSHFGVAEDQHWQCESCQSCLTCYESSIMEPLFKCYSCFNYYHMSCHRSTSFRHSWYQLKIVSTNRFRCWQCESLTYTTSRRLPADEGSTSLVVPRSKTPAVMRRSASSASNGISPKAESIASIQKAATSDHHHHKASVSLIEAESPSTNMSSIGPKRLDGISIDENSNSLEVVDQAKNNAAEQSDFYNAIPSITESSNDTPKTKMESKQSEVSSSADTSIDEISFEVIQFAKIATKRSYSYIKGVPIKSKTQPFVSNTKASLSFTKNTNIECCAKTTNDLGSHTDTGDEFPGFDEVDFVRRPMLPILQESTTETEAAGPNTQISVSLPKVEDSTTKTKTDGGSIMPEESVASIPRIKSSPPHSPDVKNGGWTPLGNLADTVPNVIEWSSQDVFEYFRQRFPTASRALLEHEIDGSALLMIKRRDLMRLIGYKVKISDDVVRQEPIEITLGMALKIYAHVVRLQTRSNDVRLSWIPIKENDAS